MDTYPQQRTRQQPLPAVLGADVPLTSMLPLASERGKGPALGSPHNTRTTASELLGGEDFPPIPWGCSRERAAPLPLRWGLAGILPLEGSSSTASGVFDLSAASERAFSGGKVGPRPAMTSHGRKMCCTYLLRAQPKSVGCIRSAAWPRGSVSTACRWTSPTARSEPLSEGPVYGRRRGHWRQRWRRRLSGTSCPTTTRAFQPRTRSGRSSPRWAPADRAG